MSGRRRQSGINLIELLVSIVVISIACTGVLLVFAQTVRFSADPMIQTQALAIAEAYLDEILARPVVDPDGTNAGETRASYDNVGDYHGLSESPPRDQTGTIADFAPMDGQPDLAGYQVDVTVTPGVAVNGVPMARVDVRVRYVPVVDFTLTGFRAP